MYDHYDKKLVETINNVLLVQTVNQFVKLLIANRFSLK